MTTSQLQTDKADYGPGDTATITASGFAPGSEVTFEVEHVTDPGPDGLYGTLDDVVIDLGGSGHDPWKITDGGAQDLDGLVNGQVVTTWFVNPDDSLDARFLLTAKASDGWVETWTFTDGRVTTQAIGTTPVPADPGTANFAVFTGYEVPDSTGTGVINSFIRLQDDNQSNGFEAGYNSDGRPVQFNEDTSTQNNFSLRYVEVPKVTIDGVTYLVFNLDLNESNASSNPSAPLITLQNIKVFTASTGDLISMDPDTRLLSGATLRYELDVDLNTDGDTGDIGEANNSILLTDWNSGSGTGDYQVLIPFAGVGGNTGFAGVNPADYVYLYSEFGTKDGQGFAADGGFEEWFVVKSASMSIDKSAVIQDGGTAVDEEDDVILYTVVVTNTGSETLTGIVVNDPFISNLTYQSGDVNNNQRLDLLESWTYTGSYVVTQQDLSSWGGGWHHREHRDCGQ